MSKATRWTITLIMVLALASLACQTIMGPSEDEANTNTGNETANVETGDAAATNTTGDTEGDTTSDTPPAEATTAPTESGGQTFNFRRANAALDEINSYRASFTMNNGETAAQPFALEMEILVTTNPPATSFTMTGMEFGDVDATGLGDLGAMTIVQVDGNTYTLLPGLGCTTSAGADDSFTEGMIARPDALFEDLDSGKVTLVESGVTVNGFTADHYQFDQTAVIDSDSTVDNLTGDVYIAQEGEFIVKFVISGVGSMDGLGDTTTTDNFFVEFNVLEVNNDLVITAPAECSAEATGGDYPMLADASEMSSFAGFVNYKTASTVADAAAFYRNEMTAQGWTVSFDYADATTATIIFEKDGKTLTIAVTDDPTSELNLVSIIEG